MLINSYAADGQIYDRDLIDSFDFTFLRLSQREIQLSVSAKMKYHSVQKPSLNFHAKTVQFLWMMLSYAGSEFSNTKRRRIC